MSKALLNDHLLIEFIKDPDLNLDSVNADVSGIFEIWRKNLAAIALRIRLR